MATGFLGAACGAGSGDPDVRPGSRGPAAGAAEVGPPPVIPQPEFVDAPVLERVSALRAAIEAAPAAAALRAELGQVFDANGMPALALTAYGQAVALDPADARSWYHKGRMHVEFGEGAQALASLGRSIELVPRNAPAHWRVGLVHLDADALEEADAAFAQACEIAPLDPSGWIGRARVELQRGAPAKARGYLERVLAERPSDGYAHQLMARALRDLGDLEAAQAELALDDGSSGAWQDAWAGEVLLQKAGYLEIMDRAKALLAAQRPQEALAEVEPLYARLPDDVAVMGLMTASLVGLERYEEALERLLASESRGVQHFKLEMNLGIVLHRLGRYAEALPRLRRVIELNSEWPTAYRVLGQVQSGLEDYVAAADAFEEAYRRGDRDYRAALEHGRALGNSARWEAAVAVFDRATRDFPDGVSHYVYLASALGEWGRMEQARTALAEARRRNPKHPNLARVEARLNHLESGQ